MVKNILKIVSCTYSRIFLLAILGTMLLSACKNDSNSSDSQSNAYITMSVAQPAAGIQAQAYSSIVINVSDQNGYKTSGVITGNNSSITLEVKPFAKLAISGVAYEGDVATYQGQTSVNPLYPGETKAISFDLNPITPAGKPIPTTPADNASDIALDSSFTTDLSGLDGGITDIVNATLILTSDKGPTINTELNPWEAFIVTFTQPANVTMEPNASYKASLQVTYKDSNGNSRNYAYSWTFHTINYADPGLAACVSDAIAADSNLQTEFDITDFICNNNVTDLRGIERLVNLQTLDLSTCGECGNDNNLTDISPLSALTNLTSLDLSYNYQLADVSPLAGLLKLESLNIDDDQVVDISPLAGLTALKTLSAYSNQINGVNALNTMSALETVYLQGNKILTVSLNGLANLTDLELGNNLITSFSINGNMPKLGTLNISYNYVTKFAMSGDFSSLLTLTLNSNNIKSIADLAQVSALQKVDLSSNRVEDAKPLSALSTLTDINLVNNNVKSGVADLANLSNFGNINTIYLSSNPALPCSDIQTLDTAIDGTVDAANGIVKWGTCFDDPLIANLNIPDPALLACINATVKSTGATNASQITTLNCASNGTTNVGVLTGIDQLANLQELDLDNNTITDFSGLPALYSLTTLKLRNTGFSDASLLSSLKNLQNLYLDSNQSLTTLGVGYSLVNLVYLTDIINLSLKDTQVTTGLLNLQTLFQAQVIDLSCLPAAADSNITALDNILDGGDGNASGVVIWNGVCGV